MKKYITTLQAIDRSTGDLVTWIGQEILATSFTEAENICKLHFPYLSIWGEKVEEKDEQTLKPVKIEYKEDKFIEGVYQPLELQMN